jgi:uncharacterized damage-inducible protein DinB
MITPDWARMMARYNRWQNENLYGAAATLDEAARQAQRGAFFGSIHGTLSHLVWADTVWLARLGGGEPPKVAIKDSTGFGGAWDEMVARRAALDDRIDAFARDIDPAWLSGSLGWFSGAMGRQIDRPIAMLVVHMFNHQTHHRGQVHAMLTAAGAKPSDTDLPFDPVYG